MAQTRRKQKKSKKKPPAQATMSRLVVEVSKIESAFRYFRPRRPKSLYQTTILKFHDPTIRRVREMLWTQYQITNFSARILLLLEPQRAIACVHEMLKLQANGTKGDRTKILGEIIAACFRPRRKNELAFQPPMHHIISAEEYPIVRGLRTGACREVVRMLLNWYAAIIGAAIDLEQEGEDADEEVATAIVNQLGGAIPATEHIMAQWQEQWQVYNNAAKTIVPFGHDKGKTLAQAGMDGVRWIEERLLPEDAIRATLLYIEVVRNPLRYSDELQRQAQFARHPYKHSVSKDRTPRADRLAQRHIEHDGPRVRLTFLSERERDFLESELFEQLEHVAKFAQIRGLMTN